MEDVFHTVVSWTLSTLILQAVLNLRHKQLLLPEFVGELGLSAFSFKV